MENNLKTDNPIKAMCAKKGITIPELSKALGLSYEGGRRLVKEKSNPSISKCLQICRILDCSLDELFNPDYDPQKAEKGESGKE